MVIQSPSYANNNDDKLAEKINKFKQENQKIIGHSTSSESSQGSSQSEEEEGAHSNMKGIQQQTPAKNVI